LLAWAKSGLGDEAAKRGEQILRRLERIHQSNILQGVKPNVESYNHVLEALSLASTTPDAASRHVSERTMAIFEHMIEQDVEPNSTTYNFVIVALKNSGNSKRAKKMLRSLKRTNFLNAESPVRTEDASSIAWL